MPWLSGEARQGHELELVAHRADFLLELGDGRLIEYLPSQLKEGEQL